MFWGLVLEPGKRYSTTVEKSFHVSKAVLDCGSKGPGTDNEILSVILETEGSESLLCNLCKLKGILQESLDLNFMQGDRLTFECRGNGRIHLSGYLLPDDDDEFPTLGDEEESDEEETEESAPPSPVKSKKEKRKSETNSNVPAKKSKLQAAEEEDEAGDSDEDDDDSDIDLSGLDDELDNLDSDEDDEEEGDEDESDQEEVSLKQNKKQKDKQKTPNKPNQQSPKKQNKQNQQTPKNTPITNGLAKDQKKKTPGGDKTPNATTPKVKQVLDQGVTVKDLVVGTGAPATKGKTVRVYYVGKLKENSRVFDKTVKGEGFKFKLGKGDVIKGWDIGVQGMKVGGKRIIHCPPQVAYGPKGAPPSIPGNSSLIFEVELKSVE